MKKNKENKDLEKELEDSLSIIFDENINNEMKLFFSLSPTEVIILRIKLKKKRLNN